MAWVWVGRLGHDLTCVVYYGFKPGSLPAQYNHPWTEHQRPERRKLASLRQTVEWGWKRIGYGRISPILRLFSYFCSDSNTDSVNYVGYDTIGYRHHKYVIWVFGYGYGIGCWISGLGYGHISIPLNGFGFEYGRKISLFGRPYRIVDYLLLAGLVWEKNTIPGWKFTIVYEQANRLSACSSSATASA